MVTMLVVQTSRRSNGRTIADNSPASIRAYAIVTTCYWAFTISDGALRMLVLGHFHQLGFDSLSLAGLFVLYEFFGIVTNLTSGWIATKRGLHITLLIGLALQVVALILLAFHDVDWQRWVEVLWVMSVQALSGVAKDFTKMSSKTAVKFVAKPGQLFGVVAILTGSKNSLKGLGFFVGALLLGAVGFDNALYIMAAVLVAVFVVAALFGDSDLGKTETVNPAGGGAVAVEGAVAGVGGAAGGVAGGVAGGFGWLRRLWPAMVSTSESVNTLSLARFFLFGARDVWFVVALPVFLSQQIGWDFGAVGSFMAIWVVLYGLVQAAAPKILRIESHRSAVVLPAALALVVSAVGLAVWADMWAEPSVLAGIAIFGVLFALASSAHSYLILAYSKSLADAAKDVGFYYAANACGRLVGTVLSGASYLMGGFPAAMFTSALLLAICSVLSLRLKAPVSNFG